ncbi:MAG: DUF357 domain-containing protein [Candidatus Aenigmarchaeota archaeon]|nr:DUF357 domain-containing protein [Candidatus Aenigmarchaeota archaeon]
MKEVPVEQRLQKEIEKWSGRMGRKLEVTKAGNPRGEEFLENIRAYAKDSAHFRDEGDLVRSFEAVVWAWAWLEIGLQLNLLREPPRE